MDAVYKITNTVPFQQQPDDKVSAHALYMREYRKRDK